MTVRELREALEALEKEGHGDAVVMVNDDGQECDIQDSISVIPAHTVGGRLVPATLIL